MRLPEMTILQYLLENEQILPTQLMQKNEALFDVFINLRDFPLNKDTIKVLEEFTCHLNGHEKQFDINEIIKLHFDKKTKPNCI